MALAMLCSKNLLFQPVLVSSCSKCFLILIFYCACISFCCLFIQIYIEIYINKGKLNTCIYYVNVSFLLMQGDLKFYMCKVSFLKYNKQSSDCIKRKILNKKVTLGKKIGLFEGYLFKFDIKYLPFLRMSPYFDYKVLTY